MSSKNFQDGILPRPFGNYKNHYVLVFDLTSMETATDIFHYHELVVQPTKSGVELSPL